MSTKTIDDMRAHLFGALEGLSSGELDIERAKAISDVAQTLINSAKVEVEFLRVTEGGGSKFLAASQEQLPDGTTNIIRHRIAR